MEVISKIILGVIQGITEILPVSSSGHLILFTHIFNMEIDLTFITFLHLATALAIILGFWGEIRYVFSSKKRNFLIKILLLGIIPAGLFGLFLHKDIESFLHNPTVIIPSLILFGILMIIIDSLFPNKDGVKKLEDINTKSAFYVGLAQILALIPGTSRSGITIISGVMSGMNRKVAIAFSFLIAIPLLFFSFSLEVIKNIDRLNQILKQENIIGGLAAFTFAYFTILVFKKLANTKFLTFFGIYRILLGITMIILLSI